MISYDFIKSKFLWISILLVYLLLHISKLELYPLCLFGMYSMPLEKTVEDYSLYTLEVNQKEFDYTEIPYKKFLMVNNTLRKYAGIIENNNVDPRASVLSKTMARIPGSFLDQSLEQAHHYTMPKENLLEWLHRYLDIPLEENIVVKKQDFILVTDRHYSSIGSKLIASE